jgi:plastocyanin
LIAEFARRWLATRLTRGPLLLCAAILFGAPATPSQVTVTGQIHLIDRGSRKPLGDNSEVVVWLTPLTASRATLPSVRQQDLRLVQRHKMFEPHLLVVEARSLVQFPNDDPFFHNVFSLFEGKRFDLGLYEAGSTRSVLFDKPGICYLFCNIHPEMSAVIVVVATPYFAVSDRAGEFSIPNVIPGTYEVRVWNERSLPQDLDALTRKMTVSETERALEPISLAANPNQSTSHKNKYGLDYDSPTPPSSLYSQP